MNATAVAANIDRMITYANEVSQGIEITFADGCKGVIPFSDIPEIGGPGGLSSMEIPNLYEVYLYDKDGECHDIPWDFARHYCDPSYQSRVKEVAEQGQKMFGQRVRQLREVANLTQDQLSAKAHIGRVTLVRIENGTQSPRFDTILALAKALDVTPEELV